MLIPTQNRAKQLANAACVAALSAVACGCASFDALSLPDRPAHAHHNRHESEGIVLAAELIASPAASAHYFGGELRNHGYFPVILAIENRSLAPFELERRVLEVVLENGERFSPVAPLRVLADVERSQTPAYLLAPLVIPSVLLYRHTARYNFDLARDYLAKALPRSIRLLPGDPPRTFAVFFRDERVTERPLSDFRGAAMSAAIDVEATSAGDESGETIVGRTIQLHLSLSPELEP